MDGVLIHVLTLFPDIFEQYLNVGITRQAIERNVLQVNLVNIRDFSEDRHGTVDDAPYGGGAGMIMKPDVLARSLKSVTETHASGSERKVIFLTPQGERFNQLYANNLSMEREFVLVCGRYRGIDERFRQLYVTDELSIGDYVLSGGEPAAMVVIDAVARLIPGAINDFESGMEDSFQDVLLDCPWYTRPRVFEGSAVPDVLFEGNHAAIKAWRREQSLKRTLERRPDLLENDQ